MSECSMGVGFSFLYFCCTSNSFQATIVLILLIMIPLHDNPVRIKTRHLTTIRLMPAVQKLQDCVLLRERAHEHTGVPTPFLIYSLHRKEQADSKKHLLRPRGTPPSKHKC
ncbi:unnamed protein product [Pipistrellus nathusii]|uniref:Secreted protein n=1 Tax=Pipistrellus nathusii TaxID=59473 RepID=A0ABN9ZY39_PIPNA